MYICPSQSATSSHLITPLEKEMATHSSILAWRIPWTEDPGRLQSMGSQRVRHDWVTSLHFTSSSCALTGIWIRLMCVWIRLVCVCVLVAQLCLTLCNPMDRSPPGSSVHGILQARILEWVAVPFSRGSSQPREQTPGFCVAGRVFTIWATRESE